MTRRRGFLRKLRDDESGATMLEYVLLIGFIAGVAFVAVTALGSSLRGPFQQATSGLS